MDDGGANITEYKYSFEGYMQPIHPLGYEYCDKYADGPKTLGVESVHACQKICDKEVNCEYFTYYPTGTNRCYTMSENQCGKLTKYKNTGTYQTQTYKKYQSNIKIPATSTVESPMLMITAETQYTHVIRKSGEECKSADNQIGEFDTIEECAAKCVA